MRNEVIFDDRGRPDILVVFTPDELKLPDTLKGRKVKEYAISKYPNTTIDGRPYSLPFMPPAVNVNHDEAIRLCEAKGPGWHLITNDEWAALARQSWENDTVPTGNTNSGKSHSHPSKKALHTKTATAKRWQDPARSGGTTTGRRGVADMVGMPGNMSEASASLTGRCRSYRTTKRQQARISLQTRKNGRRSIRRTGIRFTTT